MPTPANDGDFIKAFRIKGTAEELKRDMTTALIKMRLLKPANDNQSNQNSVA